VEDGVSFCPQCSAPQIRVSVTPPDAAPLPAGVRVLPPGQVAWPYALRAAAVAGGSGALLCILLAPLLRAGFVLGMVVAGAICVSLYRRRQPLANMTSSMGARLGAVAGLFGFVLFAAVQSLMLLASPGPEIRQALHDAIQQAAMQNPDPKVQEMMHTLLTPEGMAAIVILAMLLFLVMFVIFGVIGGGLWASLQKRRD
jgi:hypothetical protein